jgi:hypothetical protein
MTSRCGLSASVLTLVGCAQILGADDYQKAPAGPLLDPADGGEAGTDGGATDAATTWPIDRRACGLPYGSPGCETCVAAQCCAESAACSRDPGCAPYAACLGACNGDPTCRATCGASGSPPSSDAGSALSACLAAQCESECGLTCGAPASYGVPPSAAPGCQGCIAAKGGCDTARACGASAACDALRRCATGAATFDSKWACWDDAPDAGATLAKALDQTVSGCAAACATGSDWTCVGHVSWPAPKSDLVTFTIEVVDFFAFVAMKVEDLSNVDVSICSTYDIDCLHPLSHGSTDPSGRVVLQAHTGVDHYVQVTSPDIVPSLNYPGAPAAESKFVQTADSHFGPLGVFKPADLQRFYDVYRDTWDKRYGAIIAHSWDCHLHQPAPGVQIAIPTAPDVSVLYGMTATATETDGSGIALFGNVPAGTVDVVATPRALGKPSSQKNVIVRPGWVTNLLLVPTP